MRSDLDAARMKAVGIKVLLTAPHLHRSSRDRGTVLLMVVGVLALIAIVAVLYGALGQADRRGSAAYTRATSLDDQAETIADYLAAVIGRDVFSTYTEQYSIITLAGAGHSRTLRSLRDYPSIDPARQSVFDPASFSSANGVAAVEAARFHPAGGDNDPWLAPTDPSYLGDTYAPQLSRPYLRYRDWLSISNPFPDGRFVNLANLRNNFQRPPGVPGPWNNFAQTMSSGLTLFDTLGRAYAVTDPTDPINPGIFLADGVTLADLNNPAHWASNQQQTFRPAKYLDRRPGAPGPATFEYLLNQWCDTDGDGFVDARWGELIDATNPERVQPILPSDSRYRYFIAVRAVDLSARINLNTATDFARIPTDQFPAGLTPADIDLRRALTFGNTYQHFFFGQELLGYNRIEQPVDGRLNSHYGEYWGVSVNNNSPVTADLVGRAGYAAFASTLESGFVPPAFPTFGDFTYTPDQRAARYDQYGSSSDSGTFNNVRFSSRAPFGLAELSELLTFDRVNDPRRSSRIEDAVGGRRSGAVLPALALGKSVQGYSPLRSNRNLIIERDARGNGPNFTLPATLTNGLADNDGLLAAIVDLRHRLTTISGARPLTAVASPAATEALRADPRTPLAARDLKVSIRPILEQIADSDNSRRPDDWLFPSAEPQERRDVRQARIDLFRSYLDALMPIRRRTPEYPPPPGPIGSGLSFEPWLAPALHYARSAELAYRMAAHLLLNTIDALDDEFVDDPTVPEPNPTDWVEAIEELSGPTAVTLRVRGDLEDPRPYWEETTPPTPAPEYDPPGTPGGSANFPFDPLDARTVLPGQGAGGGDLVQRHDDELPDANFTGLRSGKVNIFGIEAQPFIAEVSSFVGFWDAPPPRGDDEIGSGLAEVTINRGSMTTGNSDLLFEAIAFQITNPFDREVVITPQGGHLRYYIEYAGQFFQLAEQTPAGGNAGTEIILRAGQTRVFYATNPPTEDDVNARLASASAFTLSVWASRQYGIDSDRNGVVDSYEQPVHIPMISGPPSAGGTMSATWLSTLPDDLHARNVAGVLPDDRKVLYLWRFVKAPGTNEQPTFGAVINVQGNDLLADRIRVPASGSGAPVELAIPEMGANDPIVGTNATDDDTGFCIGAYSYVRRPTNFADAGIPAPPPPSAQPSPRGALPPWCLESRANAAPGYAASLNAADTPYPNPPTLNSLDFSVAPPLPQRYRSLDELVTNHLASAIDPGIGTAPERKTDHALDTGGRNCQSYKIDPANPTGPRVQKEFGDVAVQVKLGGRARVRDASFAIVYERLNPGLFSRVGDLLLPLAIGPVQEPTRYGPAGPAGPRAEQLEAQWLTLSEALALATDYYTPSPTPTIDMYYLFGRDDPTDANPSDSVGPRRPLADRGNLVLDDFVPFLDTATTPPVPPALPTFEAALGDRPLGTGIPLALNILDKFRTDDYGSLTSVVPGKLNINTAPTANLQVVPCLTPDPRPTIAATPPPPEAWWIADDGVVDPPPDLDDVPREAVYEPTLPMPPSDVATTAAAYRDKTALIPRPAYTPPTFTPSVAIDFRDANNPATVGDGRRDLTGIEGLRERRGFGSLGELLAARFSDTPNIPPGPRPDVSSSIDFLGRDLDTTVPGNPPKAIVGHKGLDAGVYRTTAYPPGVRTVNDEIGNDYDEKLAIASAALGTTTVRSDIFALWFVVHGYLPSDVEVSDPNSPMTPTLARRYLMVIDRSNVVRPSDKPKILMLQEVPL